MSNQDVVEFVRSGVAEDKSLEKICEEMMDNCLADDQTSSGLGYDNMSVMVIGILNGKTEKEWYEVIKEKEGKSVTKSESNDTSSATATEKE
jgi:protein phosphatase 2C family protein 2/3